MAAGIYNFTIEQGTTVDFEIAYKDSNSDPIDLTGYQARMQFKNLPGGNSTYLTLSSSLDATGTGLNLRGSSGTNPFTSGTIGVFIAAVTSSLLDFNTAFYDLELVSGNGNTANVTRVIQGKVTLDKEVTTGAY